MTEPEALALTLAIELPVGIALAAAFGWRGRGLGHLALALGLASLASHPQLWTLALWLYPRLGFWPGALLAESLVVLFEAGVIAWGAGLSGRQALSISLLANGTSVLVGLSLLSA